MKKLLRNTLIIVALIVVAFLGADYLFSDKEGMPVPGQLPSENAAYKNISSQQLSAMLSNKDFFFANVHTPYEGEIENTDAFIPYDQITANLDKLPKDKNAKIVLYCRSGRMSAIAAGELANLGYTNVSHLAGGMIDWEKNGYAIIKK